MRARASIALGVYRYTLIAAEGLAVRRGYPGPADRSRRRPTGLSKGPAAFWHWQAHQPILLSLPSLDADHHALAVNIGGLQVDRLGDAQPGGVAGGQDRGVQEPPLSADTASRAMSGATSVIATGKNVNRWSRINGGKRVTTVDETELVRPERLELPAYWFEASRSIQLSYGRTSDIIQGPAGRRIRVFFFLSCIVV